MADDANGANGGGAGGNDAPAAPATATPQPAPVVLLSASDRAPQLQLDASRLIATSRKGYRSVRATHGVAVGTQHEAKEGGGDGDDKTGGGGGGSDGGGGGESASAAGSGTFYWEAEIARIGATGHARLGWSTRASDVGGPVGYDAHGYGFRDVTGEGVHCGWRRAFREGGASPFKEGDVVGLLLHVPASAPPALDAGAGQPSKSAAAAAAAAAAASKKATTEDETAAAAEKCGKEDAADADADSDDAEAAEAAAAAHLPPPIPGSFVGFSVNGAWQGRAYEGRVRPGTYYPTVSLYTLPQQAEGACVRANFGPAFRFPPPPPAALGLSEGEVVVRPVCELAAIAEAAAAAAAEKEKEKEGKAGGGKDKAGGDAKMAEG